MSNHQAPELGIHLTMEIINGNQYLYRIEKISYQGQEINISQDENNDIGITEDNVELHWPVQYFVREVESSQAVPKKKSKVVFVRDTMDVMPL
ncbi:MAG: hypothetical protein MRZ79_05460 [Bacteroidia bacterium]|nr:hypothetical protein [Bacteroidia bacterium]